MADSLEKVTVDTQACETGAAASGGATPSKSAPPGSHADERKTETPSATAKQDTAKQATALEPKEMFWDAWSPAQRWAIVALAALGIAGTWWLLSGRPPPPPAAESDASVPAVLSDEVQKASSEQAASTNLGGLRLEAAEASVKARQAAEVVFENAPKDGQAWDMSASIRGIPGAVAKKAGELEKRS